MKRSAQSLLRLTVFVTAVGLSGCGIGFSDPPEPPTVATDASTDLTTTGGTLNGQVSPNGNETTSWFEWGRDETYGSATDPRSLGNGKQAVPVAQRLENSLTPGTVYHYRAVAQNSTGPVYGGDMTFTTPALQPPTVTTAAPTAISQSGCSFNGAVNPNGSTTTAWFELGTDTNYGLTTAQQSLGDGTLEIAFSHPITDLNLDTIYHYRAAAENEAGTMFGEERIGYAPRFKTQHLRARPMRSVP